MNERSTPSSSHSSLPILRVALIGLGSRGLRTLQRYRHLDGVSVVAVADKEPKQVAEAQALLHAQGMPAPLCSSTEVQDIFQRRGIWVKSSTAKVPISMTYIRGSVSMPLRSHSIDGWMRGTHLLRGMPILHMALAPCLSS